MSPAPQQLRVPAYPIDAIPDIVTILDPTGRHRYTNLAGRGQLGHDFGQLGMRAIELVHPDDAELVRAEIARLVETPRGHRTFRFRIAHADGSWRHLQTFGTNLVHHPDVGGLILHSHDVTELQATVESLEHERLHDRLTGFPSRRLFLEHLRRALRRAARRGSTVAVFGVGINGLTMEEPHARECDDEQLVLVGRHLESVLRGYDTVARSDAVVARLDDAFLVLCEDVPDAKSAAAIATRLAGAVREREIPAQGNDRTTTVGVVLSSPDTPDAESLLIDATSAMHVGRDRPGGGIEFYDEAIRKDADRRVKEVRDLQVAVEEQQLHLLYQPQVDVASGELRGVEALVRWQHPQLGMVPPAEFIPLAEECGLIESLGEWVLTEACRQRGLWAPLLGDASYLRMSVNVSSRQFDASFPDLVARVLRETRAPVGSLCIEVTETSLMQDVGTAIETMRQLRDLGVQISIDDFGTGYSSLAQLRSLPIDELKIDQSFVTRLGDDREDTAIVSAIIAMAHALGISVIAEGVETSVQLTQLRDLGCDRVQGFLFSEPVAPESIRALISGRALQPMPKQPMPKARVH